MVRLHPAFPHLPQVLLMLMHKPDSLNTGGEMS
jgi:hypothetical protein